MGQLESCPRRDENDDEIVVEQDIMPSVVDASKQHGVAFAELIEEDVDVAKCCSIVSAWQDAVVETSEQAFEENMEAQVEGFADEERAIAQQKADEERDIFLRILELEHLREFRERQIPRPPKVARAWRKFRHPFSSARMAERKNGYSWYDGQSI
eukprot:GEMP01032493.1.p1 GENE.GEMP01032493.1~~GEMP01032493.1.p1  ORF type:complete len:155 (+),score=39.16 GEMP01032493.1:79-543(+)